MVSISQGRVALQSSLNPWECQEWAGPPSVRVQPRIPGRVRVHRRAAGSAGVGQVFEVPGFVAVDLAEPVRGTVRSQPRNGRFRSDFDGAPVHVRRRFRGGHPEGCLCVGTVLGDGVLQQPVLIFRGAPTAVTTTAISSTAASTAVVWTASSSTGSRLDTAGWRRKKPRRPQQDTVVGQCAGSRGTGARQPSGPPKAQASRLLRL